jgi:hypothetical protein
MTILAEKETVSTELLPSFYFENSSSCMEDDYSSLQGNGY